MAILLFPVNVYSTLHRSECIVMDSGVSWKTFFSDDEFAMIFANIFKKSLDVPPLIASP